MQTGNHLFLIGFMGCGKTHWGRLLAKKTGLPFLDLDDWISQKSGESIAQIFAEKGEHGFRVLERDALQALEDLPRSIIATGGGTPCFFDNLDWMNEIGTTVYLKTSPTLLAERLHQEKEFRPLLAEVQDHDLQDFIAQKLEEREHFYLQAKVILAQSKDDKTFLDFLENACA
ncbi:MAG: shikimate kinase [Saprospiraceae bacterium]|nr:shikimate kinase [Saprospiraceae bacterium]